MTASVIEARFAPDPRRWAGSSWQNWARIAVVTGVALSSPLLASSSFGEGQPSRAATAERFFRGVYGCDASVVEELAAPDVIVSYPIFETVLGSPSLRGVPAVRNFVDHFCKKWAEPEVTIHESLSDGLRAVLVWSFTARDTAAGNGASRASWGGISLFTFNEAGQITAEVGEESSPGPIGRLREAAAQ